MKSKILLIVALILFSFTYTNSQERNRDSRRSDISRDRGKIENNSTELNRNGNNRPGSITNQNRERLEDNKTQTNQNRYTDRNKSSVYNNNVKKDYNNKRFNSKHSDNRNTPYHFRSNLNYRYVHNYGHVVREFNNRPIILKSGVNSFYLSDGYLYRYHSGVGYVWMDRPHTIYFQYMPSYARRVIIHGNIYFKIGNSYFEKTVHGFRLIIFSDYLY
jgi:hypothetical protein